MVSVVELASYPVKGCAGTPLTRAVVTAAGLAHDRAFMVVDADGGFRSQRRDPGLALVRPAVSADGTELTLRAPGRGAVRLPVVTDARPREVRLFTTVYRGVDQGDEVAGWLTEVLGAPSRLVRVPADHDRVVPGETMGTSGWADSGALHLTTVTSLRELNDRITARGGRTVPMNRFRPNVVVDGWDQPHAEDGARRVTAGGVELGLCKLAIRCSVALVDQDAGRRAGPEPLRTLADYRRVVPGAAGVAFGVKYAVLRPGPLAVGDELRVTSWAPGPNVPLGTF